jgi:hypothetical protein
MRSTIECRRHVFALVHASYSERSNALKLADSATVHDWHACPVWVGFRRLATPHAGASARTTGIRLELPMNSAFKYASYESDGQIAIEVSCGSVSSSFFMRGSWQCLCDHSPHKFFRTITPNSSGHPSGLITGVCLVALVEEKNELALFFFRYLS